MTPAYKFLKKIQTRTEDIEAAINEPNGDVAKVEGYRLPTWQEHELVRTNRGQIKSNQLLPIITTDNFESYVDIEAENAAALAPLVIDGQFFYDLYSGAEFSHLNETKVGKNNIVYGYTDKKRMASLTHPAHTPPETFYITINKNLGFRLVRTIMEKKP